MSTSALICLEGIDGSGTSTQARRLGKRLEKLGVRWRVTHFPDYGTPIGKLIEGFLLHDIRLEARTIRLLYTANRWERASEMERALRKGVVVILDRYSSSNIAYGVADGLDKKWLEDIENALPQPSLTILIDLSSREALRRKRRVKKLDRYEKNIEYVERVRHAYLRLAKEKGWKILDGVKSREELEEEIWDYVNKRLPRRSIHRDPRP
ncbi:MAG: dTMP kinase [Nitrososphaeria archaeon]